MAAVRTLVHIPDTWKFPKTIPVGYKRIDIVADAYREISLKFAERVQRGISSKVVIRSANKEERKALIGFHAFAGNNYTSAFFRKTKTKCWKLMLNHNQFEECFAILGDTSHLSVTSFRLLEHFVSLVYGGNDEGVNQLRYQIFTKKQAREKKVVDLANLPPCQSVLRLHSM